MRIISGVLTLSLCVFLGSAVSFAQVENFRLWGVSSSHNSNPGYGSIFSVNTDGTDFQVAKKFEPNLNGSMPIGGLLKMPNGDLIGMTSEGGTQDGGVIYRVHGDGTGYLKLFDFSKASGIQPKGNLIQATNGDLYGLTSGGGSAPGTIFRIHPDGTGFVKLHTFVDSEGNHPQGGLVQASDGDLYGMTFVGGLNRWGTVFKISPDGTGFQKLLDFDGTNDQTPWGNLIEGQDGYLYGLTGSAGDGGIFKVNKSGQNYQQLHKFSTVQDADGRQPQGTLVQLANGDLVGVTSYGGAHDAGVLFTLKPNGANYSVLYDFAVAIKGGIILGSSGKLYGVADDGGGGMVYSINTNGTGFTSLYALSGATDGAAPRAITESTNGVFIGVAVNGAASNNGTVFKLTEAGAFTKLIDFFQEGADPEAELLHAQDGDLYGTTLTGGRYGYGILFKIKVDGSGYTKLYDFQDYNYVTSFTPPGSLVESGAYFYGTRPQGIFRIKPNGTDFSFIKNFDSLVEGTPRGNLVLAVDGDLYGATSSERIGGPVGILYKIHTNGTGYTTVLDLATTQNITGTRPASIMQHSSGDFYVITTTGGADFNGTLFKVSPNGTGILKLKDLDYTFFTQVSKNSPLEGSDGVLYGATFFGPTVYSMKPDGSGYVGYSDPSLYDPVGTLIEPTPGKLFGAHIGGLFKFDVSSHTFTTLYQGLDEVFMWTGVTAVQKQPQSISFAAISTKHMGDPAFSLTATSSLSLPITFTSSNSAVATVSGNEVTIVGVGSAMITAWQDGTITIAQATAQRELLVSKNEQTISFTAIASKTLGDPDFTLSATASSGLAVEYSGTDNVTITGSSVKIVKAGKATITASQPGDASYNAAAVVAREFCILPLAPVITVAEDNPSAPVLASSSAQGNQWYRDGVAIAGETNQEYTASESGSYTVITSVDGCSSVASAPENLVITGVNPDFFEDVIQLYPNPARNEIIVEWEPLKKGPPVTIAIYDFLGREIDHRSTGDHSQKIDVRKYAQGTYVIRVIRQDRVFLKHFAKE